MTDYFALLGEARRPWLDAQKLKEKYFARSRMAADAELNEAFRVLSEPKLRLRHLLMLEGADLSAGRPVPPELAELFWQSGTLLREIERWSLQLAAASSSLARALLEPERAKLAARLDKLEEELRRPHEAELAQLKNAPNDLSQLVKHYDRLSYLSRLLEQVREKGLAL